MARPALASRPSSFATLAACELKLNFDFYGPARISETALHFLTNFITHRLRERQIGLSGRAAAALKWAKVGIERRHFESMRMPRYFDILESGLVERLSQTSRVTQ